MRYGFDDLDDNLQSRIRRLETTTESNRTVLDSLVFTVSSLVKDAVASAAQIERDRLKTVQSAAEVLRDFVKRSRRGAR